MDKQGKPSHVSVSYELAAALSTSCGMQARWRLRQDSH